MGVGELHNHAVESCRRSSNEGGSFLLEGLTKIIDAIGVFNLGNFGTYEAGNMLIAKIFGLMGTRGLTDSPWRYAAVSATCSGQELASFAWSR